MDLEVDEIARLAQESHGAASKRVQCKEKLAVLEAGKDDLHRLDSHRSLISSTLLTASNSQRPQDDDKSAHPSANNFGDKNDIIVNSLGRDSSAVESASTATQSENEGIERVLSLEDLRSWNGFKGPAPAAEPDDGFSGLAFPTKKDKKKKKGASVWDEQ